MVAASLKKFMPFGRNGWLRRRARAHAKDHLGQVILTLSKRGAVVSTIGRSH